MSNGLREVIRSCIITMIAGILLGVFLGTGTLVWITVGIIVVVGGITYICKVIYIYLGAMVFWWLAVPAACGLAFVWLSRLILWLGTLHFSVGIH